MENKEENKAICKKVSSMLSLYIDDKLDYQEYLFIEEHLTNCNECYKKYLYLKSLIKNLKDSYKQILELAAKKQKQKTFSIREHEKFMRQISPYVDNELNAQDCFEFRKYLMKSKSAQKELKNTYIIQKEMKKAFDAAKKNFSPTVSRSVIKTIRNRQHPLESTIIKEIFTIRTAKIAILAGLIMFGTYEFKQLDTPLKEKTKQVLLKENPQQSTSYGDSKTENSNIDFIKF